MYGTVDVMFNIMTLAGDLTDSTQAGNTHWLDWQFYINKNVHKKTITIITKKMIKS